MRCFDFTVEIPDPHSYLSCLGPPWHLITILQFWRRPQSQMNVLFPQPGILTSKRRNQLGADMIEALQFLTHWFRCDLIFHKDSSVAPEKVRRGDDGLERPKDKDTEENWVDQMLGNDADDDDGGQSDAQFKIRR